MDNHGITVLQREARHLSVGNKDQLFSQHYLCNTTLWRVKGVRVKLIELIRISNLEGISSI
jgi:hypothetical protein